MGGGEPVTSLDIKPGHYALVDPDDPALILAVRVRGIRPPTFTVYGSGTPGRTRQRGHDWLGRVYAAIAADVEGTRALFGEVAGRCAMYGRTLTDPDSKARGVGPDCWAKLGGSP